MFATENTFAYKHQGIYITVEETTREEVINDFLANRTKDFLSYLSFAKKSGRWRWESSGCFESFWGSWASKRSSCHGRPHTFYFTPFYSFDADLAVQELNEILNPQIEIETLVKELSPFYILGGGFGEDRIGKRRAEKEIEVQIPLYLYRLNFSPEYNWGAKKTLSFALMTLLRSFGVGEDAFQPTVGLNFLKKNKQLTLEDIINSRITENYSQWGYRGFVNFPNIVFDKFKKEYLNYIKDINTMNSIFASGRKTRQTPLWQKIVKTHRNPEESQEA